MSYRLVDVYLYLDDVTLHCLHYSTPLTSKPCLTSRALFYLRLYLAIVLLMIRYTRYNGCFWAKDGEFVKTKSRTLFPLVFSVTICCRQFSSTMFIISLLRAGYLPPLRKLLLLQSISGKLKSPANQI